MTKNDIYSALAESADKCNKKRASLHNEASILEYKSYTTLGKNGEVIWTTAFAEALKNHSILNIPSSDEPYLIDGTIVVPSDRWIKADKDAVIKRADGFMFVMLRNENNADGSHMPEHCDCRDANITLSGGIWDGSCDGYRHTPYDESETFYGVNACIFLNHADYISVKDVTVINSGEFAIQTGDITNAVFENIYFHDCHADGLHIGGKTHYVTAKNISGDVGDDLVALNAFDWERSSVNFGEIFCVLCENLKLSPNSRYKAFRMLPGKYFYQDGTVSECKITDVIVKNVRGINTFKLYFQRDTHLIDEVSFYGAPGKADNIYFEDIEANIHSPIDALEPYLTGNPVNGHFSVFELGSEIGRVFFENICIAIDKDKNPMSFFIQAGAKSVRIGEREIFDAELCSTVEEISLSNIRLNGNPFSAEDVKKYICEIRFDDIYGDGKSSSTGKIKKIIIK